MDNQVDDKLSGLLISKTRIAQSQLAILLIQTLFNDFVNNQDEERKNSLCTFADDRKL